VADVIFSVEMKELRQRVNFVRNGLGSLKTDLPGQLIRFNVTGSKLTMFASGKEMFCRTEMPIQRTEETPADGAFGVMGSKLINLVNSTEAERVYFKADQEGLEVQSGLLTVNFVLMDSAILKQIEQGVSEHLSIEGASIDRSAFEEALTCAKSCTTTGNIRPDVTHVELRGGRVLSSDGSKIMIYSHDGFNKELSYKIPAAILSGVISAIKNTDAESIQLAEGANYYFMRGKLNGFTFGIRKVERPFPSVEGMIVAVGTPDDEISIDKKVLQTMIAGVALGLDSQEVKVVFDADGQKPEQYLEISSKNSLGRRSYERCSCGRTGQNPTSFPVSFKHLTDTLSVFKGDSVVDLSVIAKKHILLVRDHTNDREVVTVIPFRTDAQIEKEKAEAAAAEKAREKAVPTPTNTVDGTESSNELAGAATEDIDVD
jgi:hypothetical protein